MKSIAKRREELKAQQEARRKAIRDARAVEIVSIPILLTNGVTAISVPNIPSNSNIINVGKELALELGDTFLKQFPKQTLTNEEKMELREDGFQPLRSSNIAGVALRGEDLLLRFHSGETYIYPNKAGFYQGFNEALSPGRFLWNTIRFARGYRKI